MQISDIHFGKIDPLAVEGVKAAASEIKPDVLVVSGDLTQRARKEQFVAAREFLAEMPQPQVVVPGNHDVPLYNLWKRFKNPLGNYKRYITTDMEPTYEDEEMFILGVSTVRSFTLSEGRLRRRKLQRLINKLNSMEGRKFKVIVTHHPLALIDPGLSKQPIHSVLIPAFDLLSSNPDLMLAGHHHLGSAELTTARYEIQHRSTILVQAGTATSTRQRGETNSFNLISLNYPHVEVTRYCWDQTKQKFFPGPVTAFTLHERGWQQKPNGPDSTSP